MASNSPAPQRTPAQIQADLAAARARLANSVEGLIDQVHPQRIKQRQVENLKQFANAELENAKAQVIDTNGELRKERIVVVAGAVAGFVTFLIIVRKIVQRGKRAK